MTKPTQTFAKPWAWWLAFVLVTGALLACFFAQSFSPTKVVYSNDCPLGLANAQANRAPGYFVGLWWDLNWLGNEGITLSPSISAWLGTILGPLNFAKFYCPLAILLVGLGAAFCFRRMKLAPAACFLGGLAAAFNMDFFSTACWGVCATVIGIGVNYFALGFLAETRGWRRWAGVALGGLAVGMGVIEAYDIGALFSLFIAAYVLYQTFFLTENGSTGTRAGVGFARLALVGAFAAFIAVHTLVSLVGTQIAGVAGTAQDAATKAARFEFSASSSQPMVELLTVGVPGLFGFRTDWYMYDGDQPKGDKYWGGLPSPVGTGNYVGVAVLVIALWTIFQSFRSRGSPFSLLQRRAIWFWFAVLWVTALLALGKYAPFFKIFYSLPYASTIRGPVKFMHIFSWAMVILFAYGVHGLSQLYLKEATAGTAGMIAQFKAWWRKNAGFDRKWLIACLVTLIISLVGWLMYVSSASNVQAHVQATGAPPNLAPAIVSFSQQSVGWFILFLAVSMIFLGLMFSGQFAGPRAKSGWILLGALLALDLGRADRYWIWYWDTSYKYRPDPVVSFLANKPYENRVSICPQEWRPQGLSQEQAGQLGVLHASYAADWKQHLFWYYNIECLETAQEPRIGTDKIEFLNSLRAAAQYPPGLMRLWELSSTRYLFGLEGPYADLLNRELDPAQKRFRIASLPDGRPLTFDFEPKRPDPGPYPVDYGTVLKTNGQLAVIEFTGALPRASLFANWQVETNEMATLQTLASTNFNPHEKVLVADALPAPTAAAGSNADAGAIQILPNYKPKRIELDADVKLPSVLLLCDRYNPKWSVTVDGRPEKMLKCNFIERGVYLQPGKHKVVFEFAKLYNTFAISVAAEVLGLLLCLGLVLTGRREETPAPVQSAPPNPVADKPAAAKSPGKKPRH